MPFTFSYSQNSGIDSLKTRLASPLPDSVRAMDMATLCWLYISFDIHKAKDCCNEALKLSEKISYKAGKAKALILLSSIFYEQGDYEKCLDYNLRGLKIREETGDIYGAASAMDNIGIIYTLTGNFTEALKYHYKSMIKFNELNSENPDDKFRFSLAGVLTNIGYVYNEQRVYDSAMVYFTRALKIFEAIGHKPVIASILNNIGTVYYGQNNYSKALEYHLSSLKIYEEAGDVQGTSGLLTNIANIYLVKGDKVTAEKFCLRGLDIARKYNLKDDIQLCYYILSLIYEDGNDFKTALSFYKSYTAIKDSLNNIENRKNIARLQTIYETGKKDAEITKQQAEIAVKNAESKKQKIIIVAIVAGLILVLLFSIALFNRFRVTRRQKGIIEIQKQHVEEKNRNILDSIEYASRIQNALLTGREYIDKYLKDYFIFYQPKDIISGDFYYLTPLPLAPSPPLLDKERGAGDEVLVATADCTGHGVPGTLMSVLGISLLNEIIIEKNVTSPNEILNMLRFEIIQRLNPQGREDILDGMDIVLCLFDFEKNILQYAGANIGIVVKRNSELLELPGDDMPIGAGYRKVEPFTLHRFEMRKGDTLYTFSDGIRDQFGGEKGKKLGRKGLRQILSGVKSSSMQEEKKLLEGEFNTWRGVNEQTDDVTVIGIRI
ncbi:MAG: tetratricopeptide repeat protein [Bacteroidetes bacterium]|nr:tetratricopeptide repeat protein [Bacteroidota bacterium]